jgi:hypothetical protein
VEQTSSVLQKLFDWKSEHDGNQFDDLVDGKGRSVLWLHDLYSDHHPRFAGAAQGPRGIGLSIYVLVKDIEETYARANELYLDVVEPLHFNENARFREFTFKIDDGYQFTACEKSEWLKI